MASKSTLKGFFRTIAPEAFHLGNVLPPTASQGSLEQDDNPSGGRRGGARVVDGCVLECTFVAETAESLPKRGDAYVAHLFGDPAEEAFLVERAACIVVVFDQLQPITLAKGPTKEKRAAALQAHYPPLPWTSPLESPPLVRRSKRGNRGPFAPLRHLTAPEPDGCTYTENEPGHTSESVASSSSAPAPAPAPANETGHRETGVHEVLRASMYGISSEAWRRLSAERLQDWGWLPCPNQGSLRNTPPARAFAREAALAAAIDHLPLPPGGYFIVHGGQPYSEMLLRLRWDGWSAGTWQGSCMDTPTVNAWLDEVALQRHWSYDEGFAPVLVARPLEEGDAEQPGRVVLYPKPLRRAYGEGDHGAVFYTNLLVSLGAHGLLCHHMPARQASLPPCLRPAPHVAVCTVDTGMLLTMLLAARQWEALDPSCKTTILVRWLGRGREDEWVDVRTFAGAVVRLLDACSAPVETFVVACLAMSSDYTPGLPGVSPAGGCRAYLQHAAYVGDLVLVEDATDWLLRTAPLQRLRAAHVAGREEPGDGEWAPQLVLDAASAAATVERASVSPTALLRLLAVVYHAACATRVGERNHTRADCMDPQHVDGACKRRTGTRHPPPLDKVSFDPLVVTDVSTRGDYEVVFSVAEKRGMPTLQQVAYVHTRTEFVLHLEQLAPIHGNAVLGDACLRYPNTQEAGWTHAEGETCLQEREGGMCMVSYVQPPEAPRNARRRRCDADEDDENAAPGAKRRARGGEGEL